MSSRIMTILFMVVLAGCSGKVSNNNNNDDIDKDGDGYCPVGYENDPLCPQPGEPDCNDDDATIHPGASEDCNTQADDNCNQVANENCNCDQSTWYLDSDGDKYGDNNHPKTLCTVEGQPAGYVVDNTDCNDGDPDLCPGPECAIPCALLVTTAEELHAALASAQPGQTIPVAAGTYTGRFEVTVSGQPDNYVIIKGPASGVAKLVGSGGGYRGALEIHHQAYVIIDGLEITNPSGDLGVYLTGEDGDSDQGDGCSNITLRNLYVHDVGDEAIKIRNLNTHDILIENNRVHSSPGSAIDVQGAYPDRFPPHASRPRRIIIRNNLIWDAGFAGIGNEISDQLHIYNNIILGSGMGLDIGCGNNIVIKNNLVTSYQHYEDILANPSLTTIDLDNHPRHSTSPGATASGHCVDGIAISGTYMTLICDNEITDCNGDGDLLISYDHRESDGTQHNDNGGHSYNLFFRNRVHHNGAYQIIEEFDKKSLGGEAYNQTYINNIFAENGDSKGIIFEHSVNLIFANNTIVNAAQVSIEGDSDYAIFKNNILYDSGVVSFSVDSEGYTESNNAVSTDANIFVGFATGDYHLKESSAAVCIDQGADMTTDLATIFQLFDDDYDTELFNWHDDFTTDILFDYRKDLDKNQHDMDEVWDIGAYAQPR